MEWQRDEDDKCSGCGQALSDTLGVDNENRWEAALHWCDGCKERDRASHAWSAGGGDTRGLKIGLKDLDRD